MRVARAGASLLLAGALGLCCAGAAVAVQPGAAHAATSKVTASVKTAVTNKSKITFSFTGKLQSVTVNGHKVKPKVKWNAKRTAGKFTYTFKYQKKHVFKVKVKGYSAKKITRTYDKTKPTVTFTKYGSSVVVGSTVTAKDKSGIRSITANGTRVRNGYMIKKGGTYTFKVTDKAGNVRTAKVTVAKPVWKTKAVSGGVEVTGTSTKILAAFVPSTVGGQKVVAVGAKAFRGKQYLKKAVIPEGVKTLGEGCFDECVRLTSVTLPSSLTTVGKSAFFYCTRLTSIALPNRLKTIGDGAFFGTALKTVTIPNSVTSLGKYAFSHCDMLTTVAMGSGITKVPARCFARSSALTTCKLPAGVTEIGDRAFYGCIGLTGMKLPSTLKTVGEYAFYQCSCLKNLTVYAQKIGKRAFADCADMGTFKLVGKNVQLGEAVLGGSSANTVYLGAGVSDFDGTSMGSNGAVGAYALDSANKAYSAKDGVLYSADGKTLVAFPGGGRLRTFTVPAGVTAIGPGAFAGVSMDTLKFSKGSELTQLSKNAFMGMEVEGGSLELPASLRTVGEGAFREVRAAGISLNDTAVAEIPTRAFAEAKVDAVRIEDAPITSIGDFAFEGIDGVSELRLPKTLAQVGKGIVGESGIKRFVLSEPGALCVEDGILYNADKTELIAYPAGANECLPQVADTVTKIGPYAFYGTQNVIQPQLPEGLQEIGECAFVPRSNEEVDTIRYTVGENVTAIGKNAFGFYVNEGRLGRQVGVLLVSKNQVARDFALAPENDLAFASATPRMNVQTVNIGVGETQKVRVANAEGFRFFSSNKNVCTVDPVTGVITGVSDGRTTVVAAMGYYYLRCTVAVSGEENEDPQKYVEVQKDEVKSWESKYYKGNSSVKFNEIDCPAIHCYTTDEYTAMKAALDPEGHGSSRVRDSYGDDLEEYLVIAADLKMELKRHDLPTSTVLYSGMKDASQYTGAGNSLADMEASVGRVSKNPCMTSTSIDHAVALNFSGGGTGTVVRILADAHKTPGGYVKKMSQFPEEYELLLAHDVSYQVVDYGVRWVEFEGLHDGMHSGYERYLVLKLVDAS
ncbi:MAG: leucine-rich repeat protein [Coriobacteriia bacterium]|nr:leucine-rich repeat protein [Coriobacteriia bacterium]